MENKTQQKVDPNKMFFYLFLRTSVSYFKSFYKKEQEEFLLAEQNRINQTENPKLHRALKENMNKGLATMKGTHDRFLDISDYILRHAVDKADVKGQDYLDRVAVGMKMVMERINNVDDFPRVAQMIDIYNTGSLNSIFEKKDVKVTKAPGKIKRIINWLKIAKTLKKDAGN